MGSHCDGDAKNHLDHLVSGSSLAKWHCKGCKCLEINVVKFDVSEHVFKNHAL